MDHYFIVIYVMCLSYFYVRSLLPCGHLLGRLSFFMFNCVFVTFPYGMLAGLGVVLDCIDS